MANYKIIGGDQKEYGPVTSEQLRQWVAEGRANAQSSVQAEGAAEWKHLGDFPEFADLFQAVPATPPPTAGYVPPPAETALNRDYEIDIGSCISRSWTLVKQNFWTMVGYTLLVIIAQAGINQLLGLLYRPALNDMIVNRRFSLPGALLIFAVLLVGGPVYALFWSGIFKYYLKVIRGEYAGLGDAFSGFSSAAPQLVLFGLANMLLGMLGYLFCIIPGIYLQVSWVFALPLIIDRQMGFWQAMELSRKVVTRHWFIVFALVIVIALVSIAGLLACCVGIFVTTVIGMVALMYAYEDIFGRKTS
jgi:uncharacterized membrane protein